MLSYILTTLLAVSMPAKAETVINPEKLAAEADKASAPKKAKSQYNSNLYEAEESKEDSKSFTAKVRVVRDIDDMEVLFEGEAAKGVYTVPRNSKNFAAMVKALEDSRKPGGPAVTVSADSEKNIKSVEINKGGAPSFVPPSDPNKKWDFGKVPD